MMQDLDPNRQASAEEIRKVEDLQRQAKADVEAYNQNHQAHMDGMKNLDKNIAALSHDPRYQQHSDDDLAKAAYWRGACESARAAQGAPFNLAAFDTQMSDRAKVAELPDVAELDDLEITREKSVGRERDDPGLEL
jgi:hypothetical protein